MQILHEGIRTILGSVLLLFWGVSSGVAADWPKASPEEQGLDPARLTALVDNLEQGEEFPHIHSLLIVRHGHLVLEEYFAGWTAERRHTLQSVSKSFTSALIGIAIDRGAIRGVEEPVLSFFRDQVGELRNLDERKRAMVLEDLLTMRSGTDYDEHSPNSPHDQLNRLSRGWDRFYLNRPMVRPPGTAFQYDSGGVILLSSVLKHRTGLHADAFAERYLFAPLGITDTHWYRNREGHPHTGGGLSLRPRDMIKLGELFLRGGVWGDVQVVSKSWVETSTQLHVKRRRDHDLGYGYLWWIMEPDPAGAGGPPIYAAKGFMGQYIFVVPEHRMVVGVTGGTRNFHQETGPERFLYSHILPAVRKAE